MSSVWQDHLFTAMIGLVTVALFLVFGWIIGDLLLKGASHLSWQFFIAEPESAGREGGIAPIIVSTVLILAVALVVALPLGLASAVWLAEYRQGSQRFGQLIRLSLDTLAGVPSIVWGLFGNAFFCVFLGLGFSILSGGLTLACMILPIFIRTSEAGLNAVNDDWRRGGAALGMTRSAVIWHVLLPAATPAISAGLMLGIGRATAETAALIFTSGYVDRMPDSVMDSGRALAVHIYDLSMNVTGGDTAAYASALVLVALVVVINLIAFVFSEYWFKRRITIL